MIKPSKSKKSKAPEALRIVVVAPDLAVTDPEDDHALSQAKRSRALRIGLLENGFIADSFSVSDDDVNYLANSSLTQETSDLTGDYADNLYSISPNIKIKNRILK